jgi:hypothetical protein
MRRLRAIEGQYVNVLLRDGTRIENRQLVSSGRRQAAKLWLFAGDEDIFVAVRDVVAVSEAQPDQPEAA